MPETLQENYTVGVGSLSSNGSVDTPIPTPTSEGMLGVVKAAPKSKPKKNKHTKVSNISLSNLLQEFDKETQDLEAGSAMTGKKKKDPVTEARDRIEKAIKEAIDSAVKQMHRKMLTNIVHDRVRKALNLQFGNILSPAELDRMSQEAARHAGYTLGELKVIPDEYKTLPVIPAGSAKMNTHEPDDNDEI